MAKLPYSRTLLVTLTRNQNFPARRGFGTPIFVTSQDVSGQLDASKRTKLYASMEEVAVDFDPGDAFYDAAEVGFSQNPRPIAIKAAFYDNSTGITANELKTELDAILAYDTEWYWITVEPELRDTAALQGVVDWVESKPKFALLDSNNAAMYVQNDTTNIAAANKGTHERTAVFYHTDATEYGALALASRLSTFNFDEANSAYTAKFKKLQSVAPINLDSAKVQIITGFTPQIGQATATGHLANTQVDIGGQIFVIEGSTLTPNVFIDEIHATDWIIARTEEELLSILLNNKRVPFSNDGMELLASAVRSVMVTAVRAGLIDAPLDPSNGKYKAEYEITIPSVFDVPESQRKSRIAPEITVRFRYQGAVHYSTIRYQMAF